MDGARERGILYKVVTDRMKIVWISIEIRNQIFISAQRDGIELLVIENDAELGRKRRV